MTNADKIAQLNPEQREAFLAELRQKNRRLNTVPEIGKASRPLLIPLSSAQERLWVLQQFEGGSAAYHMPAALKISGSLSVDILSRAISEIVKRHEALRTAIGIKDGVPFQQIASELKVEMPLEVLPDPSLLIPSIEQFTRETFNVSTAPLFRVKLFRLADMEHVFVLSMHHLITDGWSVGIFVDELTRLYQSLSDSAPSTLPPLTHQYADFAIWEKDRNTPAQLKAHADYWRQKMLSAPTVIQMPTDRPRPATLSYKGALLHFKLRPHLATRLKALCTQAECTLFMTLLAGVAVTLEAYGAGSDIVIGSPLANRSRREFEKLIGFFVDTVPFRVDLSGKVSVLELLQRVKSTVLDGFEHQQMPFGQLVEVLKPARSNAHAPLFQVVLALQSSPFGELKLSGLDLSSIEFEPGVAKFDLTVSMTEFSDGLSGVLEYSTDLFDRSTMEKWAEHFGITLDLMCSHSNRSLADIQWLNPQDQARLFDKTISNRLEDRDTIGSLFNGVVAGQPHSTALIFAGRPWSYAELNKSAEALSRSLLHAGVKSEDIVVVCLDRSPELIIALLAIVKSGACYLGLDPNLPDERRAFFVQDSRAAMIVTTVSHQALFAQSTVPVHCLDEAHEVPGTATGHRIYPDNLAYVSYTSGSTGVPKGVAISHAAVVRLAMEADYLDLSPTQIILQFAPVSFDASTLEIWGTLLNGATLAIMDPGPQAPEDIGKFLLQNKVSTAWLTTGLFHAMVDEHLPMLAGLGQLITGGDVISPNRVRKFLNAYPDCSLLNAYGPTENTTFSCCHPITRLDLHSDSIPIGQVIPQSSAWIVDFRSRLIAPGVPGELLLGGKGIARGYLHRPDLTAELFLPDPFSTIPGSRVYRSGDLVKYRPNGVIEFLGRKDRQVKVRGFRVELNEVESILLSHPSLGSVLVRSREREGGKILVAYYVRKPGAVEITPASLRDWCHQKLPEFMIPSAWAELQGIPLNVNGKVDENSLPDPTAVHSELATRDLTETEKQVAAIFTEILQTDTLTPESDFFLLGGHSLLATRALTRLRQLSVDDSFSLRLFFENPTVAGLAALVENWRAKKLNESSDREEFEL